MKGTRVMLLRPCRLLPYPSVITELGLGDPRRGASRSHVAQLLAQILPGMASDATLDQVVQRVVDFGMGQALLDCAILDDSRLVCILEEDFGLCRFPPGRLPVRGVGALHESRIAALICRARRMRTLELSFLTWAERSSVYKPVVVNGKTTAPKRMREEFERFSEFVTEFSGCVTPHRSGVA